MGCDIHASVEVLCAVQVEKVTDRLFEMNYPFGGQTHTAEPFDQRNYGMFAFLANVRNYSHAPVLSEPRGWPGNQVSFPDDCDNYHSRSWFLLKELLDFDYSQTMESGNGILMTLRDFLPEVYFRDLQIIKGLKEDPAHVRIIFAFDN